MSCHISDMKIITEKSIMFDSVCLCVFSHIVNFFYHLITSNRACFPSFSSNHIITRISYNIVCGCFFFYWRRCNHTTSWPCSSEYLITSQKKKETSTISFYHFVLMNSSCCHHYPRVIFFFFFLSLLMFWISVRSTNAREMARGSETHGAKKGDTKKVIHTIEDKIWWAI